VNNHGTKHDNEEKPYDTVQIKLQITGRETNYCLNGSILFKPNRFQETLRRVLSLPSTQNQAYSSKNSLHSLALILLCALIASIAIVGCIQRNAYNSNNSAAPSLAPNPPVAASKPISKSPKSTATKVTDPTLTIAPTTPKQVPHTPYRTSAPNPTPTPIEVFTPTIAPTDAPTPALGLEPTPSRPAVSGYLLMVNGAYAVPNEVSIRIKNGYIMVSPMTNEDSSYSKGTEVTLGYYPDKPAGIVSWSGVDSSVGSIAKVSMDRDREVIATISP